MRKSSRQHIGSLHFVNGFGDFQHLIFIFPEHKRI